MGSNQGHAWVSLGGVDHVELSEGFFGLTRRTTYGWVECGFHKANCQTIEFR